MLQRILDLLNSAMPEVIGGVIAAAVVGIWVYLRRRIRGESSGETKKYSMRDGKPRIHAGAEVSGALFDGKSVRLGPFAGKVTSTLNGQVEKAEVEGDFEDVDMSLSTGTKIVAHARRSTNQSDKPRG